MSNTLTSDRHWFKDPRWLFSLLALALVGVRMVWPDLLDQTSLLILAIAAVPWLGGFVSSFKAFGLEAQLRDVKETANEAIRVAKDAEQQIDLERPTPESQVQTSAASFEALLALAQTYVATRKTMPSGNHRTTEMSRIFRQMMAEARQIGPDQPSVLEGLSSDDAGQQLAAVAYAYELPAQASASDLIAALSRSNQPFVQYWTLMALRKHVKTFGISRFTPADLAAFAALEGGFKSGTDRHWVYGQIKQELE